MSLDLNYLSLSGGTVTGTITSSVANPIRRDVIDSYLSIYGGTTCADGAYLQLFGKADGRFIIRSTDGTANHTLVGYPSGSLSWDNKEVERVNSNGTDYIRYESGLQICWGIGRHDITTTFPVPFNMSPYIACIHETAASVSVCVVTRSPISTTSFRGILWNNASPGWIEGAFFKYIAVGFWK